MSPTETMPRIRAPHDPQQLVDRPVEQPRGDPIPRRSWSRLRAPAKEPGSLAQELTQGTFDPPTGLTVGGSCIGGGGVTSTPDSTRPVGEGLTRLKLHRVAVSDDHVLTGLLALRPVPRSSRRRPGSGSGSGFRKGRPPPVPRSPLVSTGSARFESIPQGTEDRLQRQSRPAVREVSLIGQCPSPPRKPSTRQSTFSGRSWSMRPRRGMPFMDSRGSQVPGESHGPQNEARIPAIARGSEV